MNFSCPLAAAFSHSEIMCLLNLISNTQFFNIRLDFGDSDLRNFMLSDGVWPIPKMYTVNKRYLIKATITNNSFESNYSINSKLRILIK